MPAKNPTNLSALLTITLLPVALTQFPDSRQAVTQCPASSSWGAACSAHTPSLSSACLASTTGQLQSTITSVVNKSGATRKGVVRSRYQRLISAHKCELWPRRACWSTVVWVTIDRCIVITSKSSNSLLALSPAYTAVDNQKLTNLYKLTTTLKLVNATATHQVVNGSSHMPTEISVDNHFAQGVGKDHRKLSTWVNLVSCFTNLCPTMHEKDSKSVLVTLRRFLKLPSHVISSVTGSRSSFLKSSNNALPLLQADLARL